MSPLGFPRPIPSDDPRLEGHATDYQASRGGHFPPQEKPAPGKPKSDEEGRR
ncbi:hypothetical protein ABZ568_00815 [Streptomyces olindensis]|uniref:Uncharacterized protein n=1 Tax=Streptomyces olindensis TaxID=358823 RepID=A0ABV2XLX8_9ACTN